MKRTKKLAFSAMAAALAVVLLLLAGVTPSGRLALAALAGLTSAAVVIHCGMGWAWGTWLVAGALGLLLAPVKLPAAAYAGFLGWYPVAKSLFERPKCRVWEWAMKLAACCAALAALWWGGQAFLPEELPVSAPLLAAAALGVFVLYDLCLSRMIVWYILRIERKIHD